MKDLSYCEGKPIVVCGAGGIGKAIAADCVLAGQEVILCEDERFAPKTLANLEHGFNFHGRQPNKIGLYRAGIAKFDRMTTDISGAVKEAGVIVIALPAVGHEAFMKKIIPSLQDGQVIHIFPDNYGTLRFRKLMREMGCDKDIIVGGWSSAPYGSRIDQEGTAMLSGTQINYRAVTLRGCALPTKDTDLFLESIKFMAAMDSVRLGDGPVAADTVLDTGFSNVNPILHCPGVILGCGALENFGVRYGTTKKDFSIYCHVYSPTVSQVQYTVYCEEKAVAEACGVGIQPFEKEEFFSRSNILGPEYMGYDIHVPFDEEYPMAIGTGPFSVDSRYMTEDLPVGCHVYHELGKKFGVETPLIDSMINFGNAMLPQHNFWEEGVTLEDLGIGHMNKEQMLDYLHNGNYVEA